MHKTPFHLHGKTILVTGASGGIGAQTAISISEMGGTVILTGRNEQKLKEIYSKLHGQGHQFYPGDLTDDQLVGTLADFVPSLDGVAFSAGISEPFPVKYINRSKIEESFNINYFSIALLTSALFMKRKINNRASIVFLSSVAAAFPFRGGALYGSSKAALETYSQTLAIEHAPSGIRANCISPGLVNTQMAVPAFEGDRVSSKPIMEKRHLLGFSEPEDVANLIIFLLSDASRKLTGQNIILDSGFLLGSVSTL